jgi:hypothetical protein
VVKPDDVSTQYTCESIVVSYVFHAHVVEIHQLVERVHCDGRVGRNGFRMSQRKVIRAFGDAFAGSLARAMGTAPMVVPDICYWCPEHATATHQYNGIAHVRVCDSCKRYSMTPLDHMKEQTLKFWNWLSE